MALTVTAGSASADSYAALAATDAYFSARGVTTWTGADSVKEAALRKATTYLDNQYRGKWVGVRVAETQALAWPRADGYRAWTTPLVDADGFDIAVDAIPAQIATATMEVALLALAGVTLEPRLARGGAVKSKTVGPLSVEYFDGASVLDRLLVVEGLLWGLVTGTPGSSSGNVRLVRA